MKKHSIVWLLTVILGVLLVGCSSSNGAEDVESSEASEKEKYVIAMDINMAPFEFKENNEWVGIDVELIKAIAEVEGFEYETKHMNFSGIIPALQAGQVDGALAAMFIKEERKEILDFSDGYFESGIGAFTAEGNTKLTSEADFAGKTVAVKKGESGADFAERNKDKYGLTIRYFDDSPAVMQEVTNGSADFGLLDYPVIAYRLTIDANSGLKMVELLDKMDYGFAVKKGTDAELLQMFNDGLKKLQENGVYDEIVNKYINVE